MGESHSRDCKQYVVRLRGRHKILTAVEKPQRTDCMGKFCTACGAALDEGQGFCAKCGKPVNGGEAAAGQVGNGSQKGGFEQIKLLLLWFFLGAFGVHCFYTGRKNRGFTELLIWVIGLASMAIPAILMLVNHYSWEVEQFHVSYIIAAAAYVVFLVFWIRDLVQIIKGTFTRVDPASTQKAPTLTKKHILFLGILLGIQILFNVLQLPYEGVGGVLRRLFDFLWLPIPLLGVFFGPVFGTILTRLSD
jgi:TM2 domain-containing membrane protein YozV